jgi:hypothetical protein
MFPVAATTYSSEGSVGLRVTFYDTVVRLKTAAAIRNIIKENVIFGPICRRSPHFCPFRGGVLLEPLIRKLISHQLNPIFVECRKAQLSW